MPKAPKLPAPPESEIQRNCLAILRRYAVLAWRNNSRVFEVPGKGGRRRHMRMGLGKGSADLVGILPGGRFLAVECKKPGELPTGDQVAWLASVNAQGGFGCWIDDTADLVRILDLLRGEDVNRLAIAIEADGSQQLSYRDRIEVTQGGSWK